MSERRGDWMITFTGKRFWPLDPHPLDVDFRDIAHALSLICRYGGHVRRFYSVAEHSTLLARYFLQRGEIGKARCAAVHDASEAYVGDMVRPLKRDFQAYGTIEENVHDAIIEKLPEEDLWSPEDALAVKAADTAILTNEARALFRPEALARANWVLSIEPLAGVVPIGQPPHEAERDFMSLLRQLFPALEIPA